jgi:hypothetical protein
MPSMVRSPRRSSWLATALAASVLHGCVPAPQSAAAPDTYVIRLRLPLDTPTGRACESACLDASSVGSDPYFQCIAACPGAEVQDGAVCTEEDERPASACAVIEVREEVASDGSFFLNIVGVVLDMASRGAAHAIRKTVHQGPHARAGEGVTTQQVETRTRTGPAPSPAPPPARVPARPIVNEHVAATPHVDERDAGVAP